MKEKRRERGGQLSSEGERAAALLFLSSSLLATQRTAKHTASHHTPDAYVTTSRECDRPAWARLFLAASCDWSAYLPLPSLPSFVLSAAQRATLMQAAHTALCFDLLVLCSLDSRLSQATAPSPTAPRRAFPPLPLVWRATRPILASHSLLLSSSPAMSDPSGANRQVIEIWEPTYRMKPRDEERFIPRQVEAIIKDIMDKKLKKAKFDDSKCKVGRTKNSGGAHDAACGGSQASCSLLRIGPSAQPQLCLPVCCVRCRCLP